MRSNYRRLILVMAIGHFIGAVRDLISDFYEVVCLSLKSAFTGSSLAKLDAELEQAKQTQLPTNDGKTGIAPLGTAQAREFVTMLRGIGQPAFS